MYQKCLVKSFRTFLERESRNILIYRKCQVQLFRHRSVWYHSGINPYTSILYVFYVWTWFELLIFEKWAASRKNFLNHTVTNWSSSPCSKAAQLLGSFWFKNLLFNKGFHIIIDETENSDWLIHQLNWFFLRAKMCKLILCYLLMSLTLYLCLCC